jgi:hypothetical protein
LRRLGGPFFIATLVAPERATEGFEASRSLWLHFLPLNRALQLGSIGANREDWRLLGLLPRRSEVLRLARGVVQDRACALTSPLAPGKLWLSFETGQRCNHFCPPRFRPGREHDWERFMGPPSRTVCSFVTEIWLRQDTRRCLGSAIAQLRGSPQLKIWLRQVHKYLTATTATAAEFCNRRYGFARTNLC